MLVLLSMCSFAANVGGRYFDPLMPVVYATVLATREMSDRGRRTVLLLMVALELIVAIVGALHYRTVFWSGAV